jgi:glycine/D-amino acid oxidase-like deaminating enzyme/nitrite reductase/ring-hydroxylating ferredoxin subunit
MNVSAERSLSLWMDTDVASAPALDREEKVDVAVVGSGIAGLSTAYELCAMGRSVVVLDRGPIGGGMTSRTTAHLASTCDDFYHELIEVRGVMPARMHHESHAAAIDRIEAIQQENSIACDFRRLDGYLFAPISADATVIERELQASRDAGMAVEPVETAPFEGARTGPALRFARQGRMHPLKYLRGLAEAIVQRGGRLYADTTVQQVDEDERGVVLSTAPGHKVRAQWAIIATNTPINDRVTIHTKQAPYRTYAIALQASAGQVHDALYWDTLDPYHYVRLQPAGDAERLIVGGEDHKSGQADDGDARLRALEDWTRQHFPQVGEVTHRWSGQVIEPVDYAAFIGRNPGSERVFVITGDSGQGITGGVVGSLLVSELIGKGQARWAELYDPARKPVGAAAEYMRENLTMVKNLTEYLTGGDASLETLPRGQGAIVRQGLKKLAAYRDEEGRLQLHSAVCPHAGCIVHWNSYERCWDCPCHGSQFATDGTVLNGPAISTLEPADG